jgi:hypothetical protein
MATQQITKQNPGPWIAGKKRCVCRNYDCRNHYEPEKTLHVRVEGRQLLIDCQLCEKKDTVILYERKEIRDCKRCKLEHAVIASYWSDRDNTKEPTPERASTEIHCPVCRAELRALHYAHEYAKWDKRAKKLRAERARKIAGGDGAAPRTVDALDKILEGEKGAPT